MEQPPMPSHPVSLELACSALRSSGVDLWSPRVLGQVNDQFIKVARVQGEFPWHAHALEDEMFLVLRGELRIGRAEADGGDVLVRPGEFFVVPRGVRHNTSATEETWIVLIETVSTEHTGGEQTPFTRSIAEQFQGNPEQLQGNPDQLLGNPNQLAGTPPPFAAEDSE